MARTVRVLGAALLLAATCPAAFAQGGIPKLNGYVTLANDYRDRGLSQLASGVSLQLGLDYQHDTGFFVGGFAANVDYAVEAGRKRPRESLFDYYVGYAHRERRWSYEISVARYLYPDISFSYDYTMLAFGVSFKNRISYTASFVDELLGLPYRGRYQELAVTQPLDWGLELGFTLGDLTADEIARGGYTYWNVGLSRAIGKIGLDLRYHEAGLEGASLLGDPDGSRWVLSVTYGPSARD